MCWSLPRRLLAIVSAFVTDQYIRGVLYSDIAIAPPKRVVGTNVAAAGTAEAASSVIGEDRVFLGRLRCGAYKPIAVWFSGLALFFHYRLRQIDLSGRSLKGRLFESWPT